MYLKKQNKYYNIVFASNLFILVTGKISFSLADRYFTMGLSIFLQVGCERLLLMSDQLKTDREAVLSTAPAQDLLEIRMTDKR